MSTLFKGSNYRYYGVSPEVFETVSSSNLDMFLSIQYSPFPGFKNLAESFYTKLGTQGVCLSTYDAQMTGVDPTIT
jgi:hypothetical protein